MAYTVRSGENLTRIARSLGTTVDELVRLNGITDPDLVFPGQELIVPGEAAAPAAAAPAGGKTPNTGIVSAPGDGGKTSPSGGRNEAVAPRNLPGQAPLPRDNPERTAAAAMIDVADEFPRQGTAAPVTPVERGGPLPSLPPADWQPVPAAGPAPTTQEWAANRPGRGAIGGPGANPGEEVYEQAGMTPEQRRQYVEEADPPSPVAAAMTTAAPAAPAAASRPLRVPTGELATFQPPPPWGTEPPPPFAFDAQPTAAPAPTGAPRGEMDPTLVNRMAERDAMRTFGTMTEDQLWALDRSGFTQAQMDAWQRAVSAAAMDPQRRRQPGV